MKIKQKPSVASPGPRRPSIRVWRAADEQPPIHTYLALFEARMTDAFARALSLADPMRVVP
jgi:hypothetical protein